MIRPLLASLLSVGLLNGCSLFPVELAGSDWELVRWEGHDIPHGDNGEPVRLHFGKDRLLGFSGCNAFHAKYEQHGRQLLVSRWRSDDDACPGPRRARLEAALQQALGRAPQLTWDGPHMIMQVENLPPLLFYRREFKGLSD